MSGSSTHINGTSAIDRIIHGVGVVARFLAVALVLLQFAVVVARYLFDAGSVMAQEAILMLFGTMFMLTLADALGADRHVRIDMLYHTMTPRRKRIVDALGILILLLPLAVFMIWMSRGYVVSSWASFEGSRESAGLPGVFMFKTVIPVALGLLIVQALCILYRCLKPRETGDV